MSPGPEPRGAWLPGWGALPFGVNGWGWLSVYGIGPVLGAWLGGAVHRLGLGPAYRASERAAPV